MKLADKIKLAFNDLMHRKVRTLLTIIAISVGSLLLVAMMGLGDGILKQAKEMISSFGDTSQISIMALDYQKTKSKMNQVEVQVGENDGAEEKKESVDPNADKKAITDEELEKVKGIEGVDRVEASINGKVSGIKVGDGEFFERSFDILGVSLKYSKDYSKELVSGTNLKDETKDVIIGENYLKKLNINSAEEAIGKRIVLRTEYPEMNGITAKEALDVEGTIVGVLQKKTYGNSVVMSSKMAEPISGYFSGTSTYIKDNGYDSASAFAKEGFNVGEVSNEIKEKVGFMTTSFEMIDKILDTMGSVIKSVLSIAGIIVLIVAALGLVNTMTMTLQEKKKMIGVMRSVGGSRSNIRMIFIFQSMMLGIGGGVLGVVLSSVGIFGVNEFVTKSSGFTIPVTANNILISLGITLIISVIAGLIPSGKAAKLNVVEAVAEE